MDLTGPYPRLEDSDAVAKVKDYSELMPAAINAAIAAALDVLPKGVVFYSAQAGELPAGNSGRVVHFATTFTFKANREYEILFDATGVASVAGAYWTAEVGTSPTTETDASVANYTLMGQRTHRFAGSGLVEPYKAKVAQVKYAVDTTLKVKWCTNFAGVGSGTLALASSQPATFVIKDNGK